MLHGAGAGTLEIRQRGAAVQLSGRFPYGAVASLAATRREVFAAHAFAGSIADPEADIHLLSAHDYAKPLASRKTGTLTLRDTDAALEFDATVTPDIAGTSHGRDALALLSARLAVGLSPGFMVARGGEEVRSENGAILRTIRSADLHELSIVTAPAYSAAQVEARNWQPSLDRAIYLPLRRWRP